MNIIIPIAGVGSRFLKEGYVRPKPFIRAHGKELILWLIENLTFTTDDELVFVYNRAPDVGMSPENFFLLVDDFFAKSFLPKPRVIYVGLDAPTAGAAETVLYGIKKLAATRMRNPVVLLDGDTFYSYDVLSCFRNQYTPNGYGTNYNFENGGFVYVFADDKPEESPYSYVKVAEGEEPGFHCSFKICGIREKNKTGMSPLACSGCYCFNSTGSLKVCIQDALQKYNRGAEKSDELYTSSVIASCIQLGGTFKACQLYPENFTVLGTPSQLKEFITSSVCQPKRFCFDLDSTLVTAPVTPGDYNTCRPVQHTIDYVRKLHAQGHRVIIQTARRMKTHSGNVGAVVSDIGSVTLRQLDTFNIPYHEIYFGKPYADFYIDDKAVPALVDDLAKETGINDVLLEKA